MAPPEVWHRDRISSDALFQMERIWKRIWFPGRTIRLRALRNVYVAQEGLVLHQDLAPETSTIRQHTKTDVADAQAAITEAAAAGRLARLQGDIVLCRRPGTGNYGHFLLEMLPMAYFAAQHWNRPARFMVQNTGGPLEGIMIQALARLGISGTAIIQAGREPVLVENLVVVEGLTDHGAYISPLVFHCLDQISQGIAAAAHENIFVSRGRALTRTLDHEAEISAHAALQGFGTFQPGNCSFADQVAVFKGASRIVGVAGATLSNIAFAQPGSEIIMLTPAHMPDTFFWFLCSLRGLKLIDIRCQSRPSDIGNPSWDGALSLDPEDAGIIFDTSATSAVFQKIPSPSAILDLFDPDFYAAPPGCDALEHYCKTGWKEGRDPSRQFSTTRYLRKYPDVAKAGLNPLLHYVEHGLGEGRSRFAARS
jgi:capsular polysaccharide biosynthesis protein